MFTLDDQQRVHRLTGLSLHVVLNGRDISADCFAADLRGYAYVFLRDPTGAIVTYRDASGQRRIDWRVVFGDVRFEVT